MTKAWALFGICNSELGWEWGRISMVGLLAKPLAYMITKYGHTVLRCIVLDRLIFLMMLLCSLEKE